MISGATAARMRRSFLVLLLFVAACAPTPLAEPTATPASLKPANLLTPRPTPPAPTTTPVITATAAPIKPGRTVAPTPLPTPTPRLGGTPILASEPLQGLL